MKIAIFLLLLTPVLHASAQEHVHEEKTLAEQTVFKPEIKNLEVALLQPGAGFKQIIPDVVTANKNELLPGQDYFPAELFLNNEINRVASPGVPHDYTTKSYNNVNVTIAGTELEHMTCYVVSDKYQVKGKKTVTEDFQYDNTYFLYKDKDGKIAYTVYYVVCTVGGLKTEYRIIKQGGAANNANTLLVAPNPADKNVTLSYTVAKEGAYTLRIKDMTGKTVYSVLNEKAIEAGDHVSSIQVDLPTGTYVVSLEANDVATISQKLIIR